VPVTQVEPPPRFHESPSHVSLPFSPGPGTVQKRHAFLPVAASNASMKPRMPYSAPAIPTTTLPLTISGADVAL